MRKHPFFMSNEFHDYSLSLLSSSDFVSSFAAFGDFLASFGAFSVAGASSLVASTSTTSTSWSSVLAGAAGAAFAVDLPPRRERRVFDFFLSLLNPSKNSLKSTNSIIAISALSPARFPVLRIRVYPPGRSATLSNNREQFINRVLITKVRE